jgi:membrane-associated phospholipid phosphatase
MLDRPRLALGLVGVLVASTSVSHASQPEPLRGDTTLDAAVTTFVIASVVGSEVAKLRLVRTCAWCDRHADGRDTLNGVDRGTRRALVWYRRGPFADDVSDATAFLVMPSLALGSVVGAASAEGRGSEAAENAVYVLQATSTAVLTNQVLKLSFRRERPYRHFARAPGEFRPRADDYVSFPSGHTSLAFAFATSSGTVASLRGYASAPWIWSASLPLAAFTGYLRIAADKHYFTDVVVGALLGAAIGAAVPLAFHPRSAEAPSRALGAGENSLGGAGRERWTHADAPLVWSLGGRF